MVIVDIVCCSEALVNEKSFFSRILSFLLLVCIKFYKNIIFAYSKYLLNIFSNYPAYLNYYNRAYDREPASTALVHHPFWR